MVESKQIERSVLSFPEEAIFTIGDLNLPMLSWDNIRVKLGRMVNEGVLRKAGKGRFYRPKTSTFGEVMPSQEEIVKDLLWDGDTPTGYITGYSRWNDMTIGANAVLSPVTLLKPGTIVKRLELIEQDPL